MKFRFLILLLLGFFISAAAFSQSIKETDYGRWLIKFTNQLLSDRHDGFNEDEINWYFYNLDKMPIPNDTTDVGIYFAKLQMIMTDYFPYEATGHEMELYRLLINASPTRISGDNTFTRAGFLSFYTELLRRFKPFEFSRVEIRYLIESVRLAPRPMENTEEFRALLESELPGFTYEGIRTHLVFILEDQNESLSTQKLSGYGIRIPVGELEILRTKINTRFNEDAVKMIDRWLWEERKRD